jgi:hypothetical protein
MQCDGGFGVASRNVNTEFYQHTPLSLIQEKSVGLHKVVREGISILAIEVEFQAVSEDDIVELLAFRSLL